MSRDKGNARSAVTVARLLGTEGFSEHVANEVKRYWKHRSGLTDRQRRDIDRLKGEFGSIMKDMSEGNRRILGRYFGLLMKMQFDTGLKIGIQAFAVENGKDVTPADHKTPLERKEAAVPIQTYQAVKGNLKRANEELKELRTRLGSVPADAPTEEQTA